MKKIGLVFLMTVLQLFAMETGEKIPYVELVGDNGGYLDVSKWKSTDMDAKVNIIFYVDPDLKDLNDDFARALQKLHLSSQELKVFVIINMQASWIPNVLIDSVLASKQKEFPEAHYVKDNNRVLVKHWDLEDNNYDLLMVDKQRNILFSYTGKVVPSLSKELIGELNDELYNYNR